MDQLEPQPFSIRVLSRRGPVVRLKVTGAVDLGTAAKLERELVRESVPGGELRLDLSGVWFIDSLGLRAIARAAHIARSRGGELRLESPLPTQARRVIEITGLQNFLRIE